MSDSDDSNHPTRPTRVPLDKVQGTDDASRRLRRPPFRGLRPRAPVDVRLRRLKSCDTTRWGTTPTIQITRHDPHGCPWTKSKERMVSAFDSGVGRSVNFVHGHPLRVYSDGRNHPTRHPRVPLDEVQGTDDVSRRLRRPPFRGLRPRAPVEVRLRRLKPSDATRESPSPNPAAKLQKTVTRRETPLASAHDLPPNTTSAINSALHLLHHLLV